MLKTDFLVIGSGIAGLNFALKASKYGKVIIVTKKEIMESNTNYAQGGIASVTSNTDSYRSHVQDTLNTGKGICNKKAVNVLVKNGPKEVQKLIDFGVGFCRDQGKLCLTKEGGHSRRRIVYAGDMTGKEIERTLVFHIRKHPDITVYENHLAIDLITKDSHCLGAQILDKKECKILNIFAKATILATGGLSQIYKYSSNPRIATGDGLAMAYRAGAKLQDLEFIQFHPTALNKKNCPHFLISETIRGEGGILKDVNGKPFMKRFHPKADLAPRDTVTRAILNELKNGPVYLDIRKKGAQYIRNRFPTIFEKCYWYGIDMSKQMIPIAPAAHYSCGGIKVDTNGKTSINGLFAFGEVSCTGVHGANRLASNSLLESMVFSSRSLSASKKYIKKRKLQTKSIKRPKLTKPNKKLLQKLRTKLKNSMWDNVGIIRTEKKLKKYLETADHIEKHINKIKGINTELLELRNMITVSKLIATAALQRTESRGTHHRDDFPKTSNRWKKHIIIKA